MSFAPEKGPDWVKEGVGRNHTSLHTFEPAYEELCTNLRRDSDKEKGGESLLSALSLFAREQVGATGDKEYQRRYIDSRGDDRRFVRLPYSRQIEILRDSFWT